MCAPFAISEAEKVLIRLGALLHDVSHVPLSHDIERKSHKIFFTSDDQHVKVRSHYGCYDKHDDYGHNPLLYLLLCDQNRSVLARVLRRYSKPFYELLLDGKQASPHLKSFFSVLDEVDSKQWDAQVELLPSLLFHLLSYESLEEAERRPEREIAVDISPNGALATAHWGLGPPALRSSMHESWYQPFRHDIIGNTLSADLIDYLRRDPKRLGSERQVDLHLLNYYVLVKTTDARSSRSGTQVQEPNANMSQPPVTRYRCAIHLHDGKRGTTRVVLVNDIFRLLDLRHEIHEKAVMHRVVQAAIAMLSLAILLMGENRPGLGDLIGLEKRTQALHSEDVLFDQLIRLCDDKERLNLGAKRRIVEASRLLEKLIDRRVYRPLMIIPGDRAAGHFAIAGGPTDHVRRQEYKLRSLAAIVDSTYYSPFLLFASACVEAYLQGFFDSSNALCDYAQRIASNDKPGIVQAAMNVIPSRVIMWATPYKQLYKDPALVVALKNCVDRIDVIANGKDADLLGHRSTIERIRCSIGDADSKYAALWKLYVFISDGLYYTGIFDKLRSAMPGTSVARDAVKEHGKRLEDARDMLFAALHTVYANWSGFCEPTDWLKEHGEKFLAERMASDSFGTLVGRWISTYRDERQHKDPTHGLSTLDTGHYLHGDPQTHKTGRKCRDARYKNDLPAGPLWDQAKAESGTPRAKLVALLERVGIGRDVLSRLEFEQLAASYDSITERRCEARLKCATDIDGRLDALRVLFATDLPSREEVTEGPEREAPILGTGALPQRASDGKNSRAEIEKWLLDEAHVLSPRVRKQFAQDDLVPVIDCVDSIPPAARQSVRDDIALRFANESRFLYNDIKQDQVKHVLAWMRRTYGAS